ncbi:hypothetical protein [Serratia marcescens]|uniref:hypothetical protein n=1 Tax=Serratia TaxID=613 RepID=UPI001F152605|nr:hypothetical protein [Serratia marcescens]EJC0205045.1 hypothetical protein [Serratia marcescens]
MPGGIQCWNENGKLVVDIGDYNVRYIGRIEITMPAYVVTTTSAYSGLTESGSFGVVVSTKPPPGTFRPPHLYMTRAYNGGIRLYCKDPGFYAVVVVLVDLYSFL